MTHRIDLRNFKPVPVRPLGADFEGSSRDGGTLSVNSYYLMKDGQPFFGISGELHYSRLDERRWEDELIKLRLGGINVVSTYLFWNHLEETEGAFDFTGRRDIRRFTELCAKHGLSVILRVGPFNHGEVRNGGLPDWLYGKPFEVRHTNEGFLRCVRRLYTAIAGQVRGLFFRDGGPIIAVQLDNEYMHSSAAWELTTGVSDEWVFAGNEGEAYMLALRELALDCGLAPVFFTSTGWGGAPVSSRILPLWGGYPYRPWLFYSRRGEHPATEEYLYEDYHHDGRTWADDFEPTYPPESLPYACCEMGGGMMCCYYYRFIYPYKSVDALANIKIASGCNFLGYYMFHGGTNPVGKNGLFLNESQVPKLSYDYQAAVGEFGQLRESYRRLKSLHYFLTCFGDRLCPTETVLPDSAQSVTPEDLQTLRFAVRTDGTRGFLFLNNFQDHREMPARTREEIELQLPGETLRWEIGLAADENAVLPFHFDLDGILMVQGSIQPVLRTELSGRPVYVFLRPDGMAPSFRFEEGALVRRHSSGELCPGGCAAEDLRDLQAAESFTVTAGDRQVQFLLLDRETAGQLFLLRDGSLVFTDTALLEDEKGKLRLETTEPHNALRCFPADRLSGTAAVKTGSEGVLGVYGIDAAPRQFRCEVTPAAPFRYVLKLSAAGPEDGDGAQDLLRGLRDVRLRIDYTGDIGHVFLGETMISDNFCNSDTWEIGLMEHRDRLPQTPLVLTITPLREAARVNVESTMAGRHEETAGMKGGLLSASVQPVYGIEL